MVTKNTNINSILIKLPGARAWEVRGRIYDAGTEVRITTDFLADNAVSIPYGSTIIEGGEHLPEPLNRSDYKFAENAVASPEPDEDGILVLKKNARGDTIGYIKERADGMFDGFVRDVTNESGFRRVVANKDRNTATQVVRDEVAAIIVNPLP